jgi:hypothetical protein
MIFIMPYFRWLSPLHLPWFPDVEGSCKHVKQAAANSCEVVLLWPWGWEWG